MTYWCDDYHLLVEQRRLDAAQERAKRKQDELRKAKGSPPEGV